MTEKDTTEQFIRDAFEQNFEDIRRDTGHVISPHLKELALNQVLFYWRKLKAVTESITETEVKLHLPNQQTPSGRKFCIEGVVDIVRANDRVIMYDIKTYEAEYVRAHRRNTQSLPSLRDFKIAKVMTALEPFTPDTLPIIGEIEGCAGFVVAAAFSGHGFVMGPVLGKLLSDIVTDGKASFSLEAFKPSQFSEGKFGMPFVSV